MTETERLQLLADVRMELLADVLELARRIEARLAAIKDSK